MGDMCSQEAKPAPSGGARPVGGGGGGGGGGGSGAKDDYADTAAAACPADVFMFSGCRDTQTSADVGNVMSFGVPGPGGAGGAMTNSLLRQTYKPGEASWVQVLSEMVKYLEEKGYSQRPLLSTSRKTNLKDTFSISGGQSGRKLGLLIGINYNGHSQGKLNGCVNDVAAMKNYLVHQGFSERDMTFLVDEDHSDIPSRTHPNRANIESAIDAFAAQARAGDTLVFHYSGHGGQKKDTSGDEEDGMDETMIPEDYQSAGQITDDELYEKLCAKLPKGVRLVAIMDCCHSGTILDLPYCFEATASGLAQAESGGGYTAPNDNFTAILKKFLKKFGPQLEKKYPQVTMLAKKFGYM